MAGLQALKNNAKDGPNPLFQNQAKCRFYSVLLQGCNFLNSTLQDHSESQEKYQNVNEDSNSQRQNLLAAVQSS